MSDTTSGGGSTPPTLPVMPKYQSHKQVYALQIAAVYGTLLTFKEAGFTPMTVNPSLFSRYVPVAGDYFVIYSDGYEAVSPKAAFEAGYTPITT